MKILSLFDGMACGYLAMQRAGVQVDEYHAFEIDKYAIQSAMHNFPDIIQHGDVFKGDFKAFKGVTFLIGGSPCTYWSIAKTKGRETTASGFGWDLYCQYVRALDEAEPMYFIYENNKSMSKEIRRCISETFGFEPICINSALVSAQNRQRLYWVGKRNPDGTYSKVDVEQPEDLGILLKDILDSAVALRDKSHSVVATEASKNVEDYFKKARGTVAAIPLSENEMDYMVRDHQEQRWSFLNDPSGEEKSKCLVANVAKGVPYNVLAEPVCVAERGRMYRGQPQQYEAREDGKTNSLTHVTKDNQVAEPLNVTDDGKSQTVKAQCAHTSIANIVGHNNDSFGASGVAEPVNVTDDGKSQTIKAQYYKNSMASFLNDRSKGELYGATGVIERIPEYDVENAKSRPLTASYCNKGSGEGTLKSEAFPDNPNKQVFDFVAESVQVGSMPRPNGELSTSQSSRVYSTEGKSVTLSGNGGGSGGKTGLYAISADGKELPVYEVKNGKITVKGREYPIKLADGYYIIRKLSVNECKRLQTVPETYEFPCSQTRAYQQLGNGWTISVISVLINACLVDMMSTGDEKEVK